MGHKWYFVRCQSGREDSVRKQLENRIQVKGLQDVIPQILVPFERVTELKNGKRRIVSKKLYPGYLMVQADLEEPEAPRTVDARSTMRDTPGFGDFLGTRGGATAIEEAQVAGILARMSDSEERPQVAISMGKGDMVKIKSGAFDGFDGVVEEVNPDKGTIKVTVTIFGRPTPVELEYWEVEPM
ncbi:MAG: transcriptional antiterminator NusG [Planctomycetota bacterium]|jgi:transcriptional antiterminator NusG